MNIAQMNVATALYDLDDERMAGFVNRLDEINALADASPGFVWRLQSEEGNATGIRAGDDPRLIVNISVWETVEALFDFAYRSDHRLVMAQRRTWFAKPDEPHQVLWWVPVGHEPDVEEGLARLGHLRAHGATAYAFTFKQAFPPNRAEPVDLKPEPYCVGWA